MVFLSYGFHDLLTTHYPLWVLSSPQTACLTRTDTPTHHLFPAHSPAASLSHTSLILGPPASSQVENLLAFPSHTEHVVDSYTTTMTNHVGCLESDYIWRHHKHEMQENQCSSVFVKRIRAPISLVWSLVRSFDQPGRYKPFVQRCRVQGDIQVGSIRDVDVISGLPATSSTERLEILDDTQHIFSYRILGGDHRLQNYWSVVTLHPEVLDDRPGTVVVESYVVDVPEGNTKEETKFFVEALVKCNQKSLADISERLAS